MNATELREKAKGFLGGGDIDHVSHELGMMILGEMNSFELDEELTRKIGELVVEYFLQRFNPKLAN